MRIHVSLGLLVLTSFSVFATSARPIVLVHGGGPKGLTDLSALAKNLVDFGVKKERIHELKYNYRAELSEITSTLEVQFKNVFSAYPGETQFDVIAHSLGHFVALYAIVTRNLTSKIDRYIGLAGVARGQSSLEHYCGLGFCGKTMPRLIPFENLFIRNFLAQASADLKELRLCSLFSSSDRIVNAPYDSGALPGGTNIALTGYSHIEMARHPDIVALVERHCDWPY